MENYVEFNLAGFYHFSNKEKTKTFYIVQLSINKNEGASNKKCVMINVFVNSDEYAEIITKDIGEVLNVKITPNLETGKSNYEIQL